jgi:mannose-6-phosphate isomerase-like protein (cupin superfamily)
MSDYAVVSLKSVDNAGTQFGLPEESFELRMGRVPLAGEIAGVSYMRLGPGWRQPFGHRHKQQEEVYVLVNGSARMKVGDEIVEMTPWTAVRVPPSTVRALEGGPDGAELVIVGAPATGTGDGEPLQGWWSDSVDERSGKLRA